MGVTKVLTQARRGRGRVLAPGGRALSPPPARTPSPCAPGAGPAPRDPGGPALTSNQTRTGLAPGRAGGSASLAETVCQGNPASRQDFSFFPWNDPGQQVRWPQGEERGSSVGLRALSGLPPAVDHGPCSRLHWALQVPPPPPTANVHLQSWLGQGQGVGHRRAEGVPGSLAGGHAGWHLWSVWAWASSISRSPWLRTGPEGGHYLQGGLCLGRPPQRRLGRVDQMDE